MTSEAVISNVVFSQQNTNVTINVTTNSVPEDAIGTVVKLESEDGNAYSVTIGKDYRAKFDNIWKAEYVLLPLRYMWQKASFTLPAIISPPRFTTLPGWRSGSGKVYRA